MPVAVPLRLQPDGDDPDLALPVADVEVGGLRLPFLVDTGARRTHVVAVPPFDALPTRGRHRSASVFGAGELDLVELSSLRFGPVTRTHVEACRVPVREGARHILAMDVLGDLRCHFRFADGVLDLGPSEVRDTDDLYVDDGRHPHVGVDLRGARVRAVWDTGASITVVDQGLLSRQRRLFRPLGASWGTDATGARRPSRIYEVTGFQVAGVPLAPHPVAVVDLAGVGASSGRAIDLVLGWTTLRQCNWLMDFPGRRWAVTAVTRAD